MSTLHTISKGPRSELLQDCLPLLARGDGILFIEDGVYHCPQGEVLSELPPKCTVFGLREDVQARGLMERVDTNIRLVSNRTFVQLCCDYDKVISWF